MDMQTITTLIGSLGFPIAAACWLAWYQTTVMKEFRKTMDDNTKALQELILTAREEREKHDAK